MPVSSNPRPWTRSAAIAEEDNEGATVEVVQSGISLAPSLAPLTHEQCVDLVCLELEERPKALARQLLLAKVKPT